MRKYELMIITTVDFPHEDEKKRVELVKKLLSGQTVENIEVLDMGKKNLAYEIKKVNEGVYLLAHFSGEHISIGAIEQQIKLQPGVIRYLLTNIE